MAAAATAVIALLLVMAMTVWRLAMPEEKPEPLAKAEIMLEEEEFVDLLEPSPLPQQADNTPASAQLPENSDAQSQPAPESGTDTKDAGEAGVAEPPVAAKAPSEVKVKKKKEEDKKKKAGPEVDKKKAKEEAVKREANNQVSNAFASASGKHNTKNGTADKDNAGRADGKARQGNLSGRGTGTVGGGWRLPAYSPVPSTVTGSVKLVVKIDRDGRVTSVRFDGGNAPAATDAAVRAACVAEVKSRRFTHPRPAEAPESATAYITYTFR